MKITIRANPEIVIEVDSIAEDNKVLPAIAVPDEAKTVSDVKRALKGKIEKRGKGVKHCNSCGKSGHDRRTCPSPNDIDADDNGDTDDEDDPELDDDLQDKIDDLRNEGFDSHYIAKELRLPLKTVNKYW